MPNGNMFIRFAWVPSTETYLQDRRPLTAADLFEPPPPTDMTQKPFVDEEGEEIEGFRKGSSAKIDQLVHLLKLTPSTEKSLVFSQFTSFLDKVRQILWPCFIPDHFSDR